MPYIKPERRLELESDFFSPWTPGDLNYKLTQIIGAYWCNSERNYQAINDIMGALEGAKQEFYRRVAVPYEDTKIRENGDVY